MTELTDRQHALGWTQAHLDAEEARVRVRQSEVDAELREKQFARDQERKAERARLAKRYMLELVRHREDNDLTPQEHAAVAVECADALLSALDAPRKP